MKKSLLALLTIFLIVSFNSPVYATEVDSGKIRQEPIQEEQQPGNQQKPQESPVTVSTLEELQAAIDAAKDGDIIILTANDIHIPNGITLGKGDKHIILQLSPEYANVFEFGSVLCWKLEKMRHLFKTLLLTEMKYHHAVLSMRGVICL